MTQSSLILASASPRRVQLLAQIGITPTAIIPADIDETPLPREKPAEYVLRVARTKAAAISKSHPSQPVLAADTVVAVGRRILPKAEMSHFPVLFADMDKRKIGRAHV